MKKNSLVTILFLIILLLTGFFSYSVGKSNIVNEYETKQKDLQELNRASIQNLNVGDETIYVIGHKSPDSDTVCSAIAYARLLNMLGYNAEAVITEEINNETKLILENANVEVPEELLDASGEYIFLVDHSEYAQAVEGLVDAHIVGVIDHHGVGTLQTGNQVLYDARPIGCTSTIIWLDYLNYGLEIDQTTAYLMLGAILSDTSNLTGTTTTDADRKAIEELSKLANVDDVDELYKQMHIKLLSYEGKTDAETLFSDYKEYESSGVKYGIGLINSIDEETSKELAARMKTALAENFNTKNVDLMYASVGIRENGEKIDYIIPANELSETILKNAFPDYDEYDGTSYIFRSGLGRKTKFVPGLSDYLGSRPHE